MAALDPVRGEQAGQPRHAGHRARAAPHPAAGPGAGSVCDRGGCRSDPGRSGDPSQGSARDRATVVGAFVAGKLSGYERSALPVDIDVLRYEAATSSSSATVTVGTWLTRSLFVAYRQHLEARVDENRAEGELEYWLSRRVSVEATAGDRGYNGVDLLWRRRY